MNTDLIYNYTDYRQFLSEWFAYQKNCDPRFSYRVFSDMCGFKTKDFIYRVIQGSKNLSPQSSQKVCKAIKLTKRKANYFRLLVHFNQAKNHEDRDLYFTRLSLLRKEVSRYSKPELIRDDQYLVFSERHHLIIRSLINMYDFRDDYEWLAGMVNPPITVSKAKKSVQLLQKLGMIYTDEDGIWKVSNTAISTGDEIKRHSLQKHYLRDMDLASKALDQVPRSQRNFSGLTLGLSENTYKIITERLEAFRREIVQLVNLDQEADRVYALNFHLFPLSKIPDENRKENDT
ncbi:hypothetical protein CHISP_1085 [Chitinispirillum alkaliphilum]|nr:hypothetical protein CHISP_1085 [Chitinispirillum alkaliphilum]